MDGNGNGDGDWRVVIRKRGSLFFKLRFAVEVWGFARFFDFGDVKLLSEIGYFVKGSFLVEEVARTPRLDMYENGMGLL